MAEYIERGAVIDAIMSEPTSLHYPDYYAAIVNAIPAADDVAPVIHGRFVYVGMGYDGGNDLWRCSLCKGRIYGNWLRFNCCPHCGAKINGGADNATD